MAKKALLRNDVELLVKYADELRDGTNPDQTEFLGQCAEELRDDLELAMFGARMIQSICDTMSRSEKKSLASEILGGFSTKAVSSKSG